MVPGEPDLVYEQPEWVRAKGTRENIADARRAFAAAVKRARTRTFSIASRHWRLEAALFAGYVVVIAVGLDDPPANGLPTLLGAVVVPLSAFLAALFVGFLVILLHEPFLDHRKVVWERDHYLRKVRLVHLRYQLQDRLKWVDNEIRVYAETRENLSMDAEYKRLKQFIESTREQLVNWGQPALADALPLPARADISTAEMYGAFLAEDLGPKLRLWARQTDLPSFSAAANDDALRFHGYEGI